MNDAFKLCLKAETEIQLTHCAEIQPGLKLPFKDNKQKRYIKIVIVDSKTSGSLIEKERERVEVEPIKSVSVYVSINGKQKQINYWSRQNINTRDG